MTTNVNGTLIIPGSRDLGLLITLLAQSHGISEGLRFISLFDKDYQKLWKPVDVKVRQDSNRENVVHVEWNDAPLAGYVHHYSKKLAVEYTVEIFPSASEGSIKNQVFLKDCIFGDMEDSSCLASDSETFKYTETFYGVESAEKIAPRLRRPPLEKQASIYSMLSDVPDTPSSSGGGDKEKKKSELKVTISCEVNGRTIAQRTEKVPPPVQPFIDEIQPKTPALASLTIKEEVEEEEEEDMLAKAKELNNASGRRESRDVVDGIKRKVDRAKQKFSFSRQRNVRDPDSPV